MLVVCPWQLTKSFLVLYYMIQVKYWQCTEEKRLLDSPSRGSKAIRIRDMGIGSHRGNVSSSERVCKLVIQKIPVILDL